MPNLSSYAGRLTSRWIAPYASTIGLNANWNFFSPDPAHTMYIQYRVYFADEFGNELKESIHGFLPEEKDKRVTNPINRRAMYAMRFFAIDPKRFRTLLGPWLCRKYPGSTSVDIEHTVESVPPLDQVTIGSVQTVRDYSQEMQYSRSTSTCNETQDEEIL